MGLSIFSTASRPAVGPTQPPIQWVHGYPFPGVKRPEREADHSPPTAEVKNVWRYTSTPNTSPWHGAYLPLIKMVIRNVNIYIHIFFFFFRVGSGGVEYVLTYQKFSKYLSCCQF